jgi:DnaJ family protein A protein 2
MQIGRKVIDQESMSACRQCGGQGAVVRMMRMGPMVQQIQQTCDQCGGAGHSFKSVQKTEVLEVRIECAP